MRFSRSILIVAVATMAMIVSAGSAMAHINGSTLNMIAPDFHSYTWCVAGNRDRVAIRQRHRLPDADPKRQQWRRGVARHGRPTVPLRHIPGYQPYPYGHDRKAIR